MTDKMILERTSKPLKLMKVIAVLLLLGSGAVAALHRDPWHLQLAAIGAGVGVGLFLITKFLVWWNYG